MRSSSAATLLSTADALAFHPSSTLDTASSTPRSNRSASRVAFSTDVRRVAKVDACKCRADRSCRRDVMAGRWADTPSRSCSCVCRSEMVRASSADRVDRTADSLVLALAAASRSALYVARRRLGREL